MESFQVVGLRDLIHFERNPTWVRNKRHQRRSAAAAFAAVGRWLCLLVDDDRLRCLFDILRELQQGRIMFGLRLTLNVF